MVETGVMWMATPQKWERATRSVTVAPEETGAGVAWAVMVVVKQRKRAPASDSVAVAVTAAEGKAVGSAPCPLAAIAAKARLVAVIAALLISLAGVLTVVA